MHRIPNDDKNVRSKENVKLIYQHLRQHFWGIPTKSFTTAMRHGLLKTEYSMGTEKEHFGIRFERVIHLLMNIDIK